MKGIKRRIVFFLIVFAILGGSTLAWFSYSLVVRSNFDGDPVEVFIVEGTTYDEVLLSMKTGLKDPLTFDQWARLQRVPARLKPGRYVFEEGMSNREMVNILRGGLQTPAVVRFHNIEDFADLAGLLSHVLQPDSLDFYEALSRDSIWDAHGISDPYRLAHVIPNTYEMYWTTSAEDAISRLIDECRKFWNAQRLDKAEELGLTPEEVTTLASIVQKETYMADELGTVAGLYLNRLDQGWKLQSDPTVKYAYELAHPEKAPVRRILYVMLEWDSPYNTYLYEGLPPGPIAIAEVQAIDAVLNPKRHDYLFMCANPENPGYHAFAKTARQHARNRRKYITWLES